MLAAELGELGASDIGTVEGGVGFGGTLPLAYSANLHSRIASRVLWEIGSGRYRNEDDVYRGVYALDWQRLFDPGLTIRVNVAAVASPLKSLEFITLRIKDAACDKFRGQTGSRPSVDTAQPDVRIHAFLDVERFTIYLDTSGEPLFKRGSRQMAGEAPLARKPRRRNSDACRLDAGYPAARSDVRQRHGADRSSADRAGHSGRASIAGSRSRSCATSMLRSGSAPGAMPKRGSGMTPGRRFSAAICSETRSSLRARTWLPQDWPMRSASNRPTCWKFRRRPPKACW